MLILLALLVLLMHVMMLTWLRQSMDLPKAPVMPIPFKMALYARQKRQRHADD
ncbi:MAG: hypothetical protein WCP01_11885 [Methylococcaceae bacterium]